VNDVRWKPVDTPPASAKCPRQRSRPGFPCRHLPGQVDDQILADIEVGQPALNPLVEEQRFISPLGKIVGRL